MPFFFLTLFSYFNIFLLFHLIPHILTSFFRFPKPGNSCHWKKIQISPTVFIIPSEVTPSLPVQLFLGGKGREKERKNINSHLHYPLLVSVTPAFFSTLPHDCSFFFFISGCDSLFFKLIGLPDKDVRVPINRVVKSREHFAIITFKYTLNIF